MYKDKICPRIIVILIILHLFTLTTIMSSFVLQNEVIAAPLKLDNEFFISEDPLIAITHDDNFTTLGCPGDGSPGNPYRIENFNITSGGADLISISNTRKNFIIQNCTLQQSGGGYWPISLYNVSNAIIFDNEISNNYYSMNMHTCTNVTIQKNNITSNNYGLFTYLSYDIDFLGNYIETVNPCFLANDAYDINFKHNNLTCNDNSIWLSNVDTAWFENNTITHSDLGMRIDGSDIVIKNNLFDNDLIGLKTATTNDILIFNNTFTECDVGLFLESGYSHTIANNTISDGNTGINVYHSDDNLLENNTVSGNAFGITVAVNSDRNWLVGNFLEGNAVNGEDNGTDNFFGTNYWSDYVGSDGNADGIGDIPHPIAGTATNADPHPLMTPTTPRYFTTWLQTPTDQHLEFGDTFRYDLNCTTPEPIYWWLSGAYASWFSVDSNGVITNTTLFTYELNLPLTVWARNIYSFTITSTFRIDVNDTLAPTWDEVPTDQFHEFGHPFSYDLNASDGWGIDHYWINGSAYFYIEPDTGILVSSSPPIGVYGFEVRAYDPEDKYVSAIFTVTVADTIPPTVTHPEDQEIVEGTQVITITWVVYDLNYMNYQVIINGVYSGWSGVPVDNTLDFTSITQTQSPGTYNYTIVVTDGYNIATDTVLVVIISSGLTSTTTDGTPPDSGVLMLVVGVGIVGVVIVIVVFIITKRR